MRTIPEAGGGGIAVGTVKNHRRRSYEKLDITSERELFLQFVQHHDIGAETRA